MVALKHPHNGAVVEVATDLVERFTAQGWVRVDPVPAPVKRRPGRPRKKP